MDVHANKTYHKEVVVREDDFLKVLTHQKPDISCQLNQEMENRVRSNQQKLSSMFDAVMFLCVCNTGITGHNLTLAASVLTAWILTWQSQSMAQLL